MAASGRLQSSGKLDAKAGGDIDSTASPWAGGALALWPRATQGWAAPLPCWHERPGHRRLRPADAACPCRPAATCPCREGVT
ncbi:hypothetical protein WJ970_02665 [Achromobacter xylosoxidans]